MHRLPNTTTPTSPRRRHDDNIAALKTMLTCQRRHEQTGRRDVASSEEKGILSKYTGFGDVDVQKLAFDHGDNAIGDLARLGLDESLLKSIRRSTLDAYYTPPEVVDAMWSVALRCLGDASTSPYVLEPACGVGAFYGRTPTALRPDNFVGVECDAVSFNIAWLLYPEVKVTCNRFEDVASSLPSFDLVIGNVPFGDVKVVEAGTTDAAQRIPGFCCRTLHDYFVCRSVLSLRRGGVAVLLTSTGTLGKGRDDVRQWVAQRAELLLAVRLCRGTFAGTDADCDLLVLRRRDVDKLRGEGEWLGVHRLGSNEDGVVARATSWSGILDDDISLSGCDVNDYYRLNPEHAVGEWTSSRDRYNKVVAATMWCDDVEASERLRHAHDCIVTSGEHLKPCPTTAPSLRPEPSPRHVPPAALSPLERGAKRLLEALRKLLAAQQVGDDYAAELRLLNGVYDDFVRRWGRIRDVVRGTPVDAELKKSWPLLRSLETRDGAKSSVFSRRLVGVVSSRRCVDVGDAMYVVLNSHGVVDVEAIAEVLNGCVAQQDATDEGVERRAKAVYERRATSLDWYEGSKHLEPWTKLSDAEHEAWLRPLRKY